VFLAIPELLDAAGSLIAKAIDPEARVVEAACVCAGASAGMALMSAAALSRGHPERIDQLPLTVENDIPHEFVVQSSHVVSYEQAWLIPGARVVVAGTHTTENAIPDGGFAAENCYCTEAEFEAAIRPGKTAALLFAAEYGSGLDLPTVVRIGRKYSLPVLVDSASQLPPKVNLIKYLEQGATLCCYKGGGAIRGPQSSGLILGSADWVAECRANAFPNRAIGRAMKICKEGANVLRARVFTWHPERSMLYQRLKWRRMLFCRGGRTSCSCGCFHCRGRGGKAQVCFRFMQPTSSKVQPRSSIEMMCDMSVHWQTTA
jgi:seryl-tRNA(Sec) selenium transferase